MKLILLPDEVSVGAVYVGETFGVAVGVGGTVWFGCGRDLCRLQGQEADRVGARLGLPHDHWETVLSDGQGTLWVRSENPLYNCRGMLPLL